jgi:Icc-related predicted phosphoesterase
VLGGSHSQRVNQTVAVLETLRQEHLLSGRHSIDSPAVAPASCRVQRSVPARGPTSPSLPTMRLLCTADLHYRLPHLDWLLEQAGDVDVVVMPGDHLQVVGSAPLEVQVVVVSKYLTKLAERTLVLASSGNHDLDGPGPHGEQHAGWLIENRGERLHVDGDSIDVGDVRFTVCPWWDGPRSRHETEELLERAAVDRPAQWIWVYHSPPAGTRLCTTGTKDYPDEDLARWIDRWSPDVVVCGHIHQAPWARGGGWADRRGRTWVFNAGHQPGPYPPHIIIDLDARTAEWFAVPDRDSVALDADPVGVGAQ